MLGAPGSGKGTVAKLLTETLNIEHISTGDMFREEIKSGSELGKELENYMSDGKLVPDDVVIKILDERLSRPTAQNGVVLDGFPRTKIQAEHLKELLNAKGKKINVAIQLNIPDEDIIYRTVKRRICSNKDCGAIYNLEFNKPKQEGICDICGSKLYRREDDNEETVKRRIDTYHKRSEPIIKYFEEEGILYTVDLRAQDQVTKQDIEKWLKDINEKI
jgi:adenylate kinase